jgi:hypothetical protein
MVKIFYKNLTENLHFGPFQIIKIQKFSSAMVKIFYENPAENFHFGPFQIVKIQNFLQLWWRYCMKSCWKSSFWAISDCQNPKFSLTMVKIFYENLAENLHFGPLKIVQIQKFLQPWWRYLMKILLKTFVLVISRSSKSKNFP